jgi:hypothetical protein
MFPFMRQARWLLLLLACGISSASAAGKPVEPAAPKPPKVSASQIFRPTFHTVQGTFGAGTAFLARDSSLPAPVVLTAHHLFGEAGGLDHQVAAEDLPKFCRDVQLADVDGKPTGRASHALFLAGAHPLTEDDFAHDLAAFRAPSLPPALALPLATRMPARGERVWLFARLYGGAPPTQLLHAATVVESTPTSLIYLFDTRTLGLRATSGAPMLNAAGEVVGVNLGAAASPESLVGLANPVTSVRQLLSNAK